MRQEALELEIKHYESRVEFFATELEDARKELALKSEGLAILRALLPTLDKSSAKDIIVNDIEVYIEEITELNKKITNAKEDLIGFENIVEELKHL